MNDLYWIIANLEYKKIKYKIINMSNDYLETDEKAKNNLTNYTLWYWKAIEQNNNQLEIKVIPKREFNK